MWQSAFGWAGRVGCWVVAFACRLRNQRKKWHDGRVRACCMELPVLVIDRHGNQSCSCWLKMKPDHILPVYLLCISFMGDRWFQFGRNSDASAHHSSTYNSPIEHRWRKIFCTLCSNSLIWDWPSRCCLKWDETQFWPVFDAGNGQVEDGWDSIGCRRVYLDSCPVSPDIRGTVVCTLWNNEKLIQNNRVP